MSREQVLIVVSGGLGIVALGAFSIVLWRWLAPAKRTTYVPKHSGEFPIVPVPHKGADDSQATSQWVHAIGSVPSLLDDPWIALRSAEEQLKLAQLRVDEARQRVVEAELMRDAKTLDGLMVDFQERLAKAGQLEQRTFEWTVEELKQIVAAGAR